MDSQKLPAAPPRSKQTRKQIAKASPFLWQDLDRHRPRQPKAAVTPGAALASNRFRLVMSVVQFLARTIVLGPASSRVHAFGRRRRGRRASPTRLPDSVRCDRDASLSLLRCGPAVPSLSRRSPRCCSPCRNAVLYHLQCASVNRLGDSRAAKRRPPVSSRIALNDECRSVPGGPSWSGGFVTGIFFVWPGCSHINVFARHRRVRGATPTRLTDSVRCYIHVASRRHLHHLPHSTPCILGAFHSAVAANRPTPDGLDFRSSYVPFYICLPLFICLSFTSFCPAIIGSARRMQWAFDGINRSIDQFASLLV